MFDRYEIWDFANQQWIVLSESPDYTFNTSDKPRKGAAYVRVICHEADAVDPSETYTITVENGYFEIDGEKYVGTLVVPANTQVNVYAKNVDGKTFDHWLDGNGEVFSQSSFVVTCDVKLSPVYKDTLYCFMCGVIEQGAYVSVNGGDEKEYYIFEKIKIGDTFALSTSSAPESEYNVFIGWYFIAVKNGVPEYVLISDSQTITYEITGNKISIEENGIKEIVLYAIWTTGENPFAQKYVDIRVENGFVNYSETPSAPSDNAYSSISVSTMGFATFFDDPTDETVYTAWDVAYRYEINGEVQHEIVSSYQDEYDYTTKAGLQR